MKISDITIELEQWAPLVYAEEFDNVGLLVGDSARDCKGVLITHDVTDGVVEEAISKGCNLIVCFHPIIFTGLKQLTSKGYVEKTVLKAIENKIAIYAIHTALDNHKNGISYHLGKILGLENQQVLTSQKNSLFQLTTYVPSEEKENLLKALHKAGAGEIGNYSKCSFSHQGEGRFMGNEISNPTIGNSGELTKINEVQIRVVVTKHTKSNVLNALKEAHPYEVVAYELYSLENTNQEIGLGSIGILPNEMNVEPFMEMVKKQLNSPYIRHSNFLGKKIKNVAVLGGSGSFSIAAAIAQKADALVTSDLKYHDFFKAENKLLLIDAGHFETEHFTKKIIHEFLTKKIPNFAITLSQVDTNPVKYF